MKEHKRAQREHRESRGSNEDETGLSAGAMQRHLSQQEVTCYPQFEDAI